MVNEEICEGLSEVCEMLSKQTKDKKYRKEFQHKADTFKGFAQLFNNEEKDAELRKFMLWLEKESYLKKPVNTQLTVQRYRQIITSE